MSLSLSEAAVLYGNYLKHKHFTQKTISSYTAALELFLEFSRIKRIRCITDVTPAHLKKFLKVRECFINKNGKQNSVGTRNIEIKALKSFLAFLYTKEYSNTDLSTEIDYLITPKLVLPKDILTTSELQKILKQPDMSTEIGYRNRVCFELLIATGIRRNELCQLSISDINFSEETLLIRAGKFRRDRVLPVNHTCLHYLKNYIDSIRPNLTPASNETLIVSSTGNRIESKHLNDILGKEVKKASLKKHVTIHSFRHTFCTHLVQAGMPLRHVQLLMGHENMDSTLLYVNLSIKALRTEYKKAFPLQ